VWVAAPLFVHVTVVPACTSTEAGWKAKSTMVTAAPFWAGARHAQTGRKGQETERDEHAREEPESPYQLLHDCSSSADSTTVYFRL